MKIRNHLGIALVALACGCQSPGTHRAGEAPRAAIDTRNNTYSLLYQLLNDERHVSKLLIIKRDSRALNRLIHRISDAAAKGAEQLKDFAERDATLHLTLEALPPGEQATRQAIAVTKRNQLLGSGGAEFERALLLTQMEALNYGAHLAKVAAKNDLDPIRSRYLSEFSETMKQLHSEVFDRLFNRTPPTADYPARPKLKDVTIQQTKP